MEFMVLCDPNLSTCRQDIMDISTENQIHGVCFLILILGQLIDSDLCI